MNWWYSPLPLGWAYEVALRAIVAGGCVAFVIWYWISYKWWRNDFGRHLMSMSASLGSLATFSLIVWVWPNLPGRGLIRMVLFTLLAMAVVWRLVVFGRVERAKKSANRASDRPEGQ